MRLPEKRLVKYRNAIFDGRIFKINQKVSRPININSKGAEISLISRNYRIYVLGGWGIDLGNFLVSFRDKKTGEIIESKRANYPIQAFSYGKRARRIFVVRIPRSSNYEVIFENSESLKVRRSNLPIISLFEKPISNEGIEIIVTEKLGFLPIKK